MGNEKRQRWIVKGESGRIYGPYTTEKILHKISRGQFSGDELISKYPGNQWYPISRDPQFYDRLLEILSSSNETYSDDESKEWTHPGQAENISSEPSQPTEELLDDDKTPVSGVSANRQPDWDPDATKVYRSRPRETDSKNGAKRLDDIELEDVGSKLKIEIFKRARVPVLIVVTAIVVAVIYITAVKPRPDRVHLMRPKLNSGTALDKSAVKEKTTKAVRYYLQDTKNTYIQAQVELIEILEAKPKDLDILGLLCLTYFELWPFSFQDSKDIETFDYVVRTANRLNPTHMYSHTCRVAKMIVDGKYLEAKDRTEEVLASYTGDGPAPIPFYYFKALLLRQEKDIQTAVGYTTSAQRLWPQWLKVYLLEAILYMDMGNYPAAYKILGQIYKKDPSHPTAKILLGMIEYSEFKQTERAQTFLSSGLKDAEQVPRKIVSNGYMTLAQIALSEQNQSSALEAAQKAYQYDSTMTEAKNMILRLGGQKKLASTKLKAHQLVIEGDQFVREGDCQSAQAHYKTAFEMDKKLAVAALKAGECMWKLSFSTEAIEWMKKSVQADPRLVDGFVLLADYYTQRYDFVAAARTLNAAQRANPKSHEVLRGYALVELRRNNPKAAISYARQALTIYEADIEANIIMAKAHLLVQEDIQQAYAFATRAIEMDPSHREAQITYARALGALQGPEYGIEHLHQLIRKYPLVSDYRLALGKSYLRDERYSDAETVFRQLIEIEDQPKEALIQLGKVLHIQNDLEESLEVFFKAAVLDPADAEPLFQAGAMLLDMKKPDKAKEQLERVLLINKKYPLVHYQIGRAELLLNNPKEALKQAEEERKINPNLANAYILAAEAYTDMKQYDLCAQEYQKAIKLRPQGAAIYVKTASCHRLSGNFDAALAMLTVAKNKESGNPDIYKEQGAIYEVQGNMEYAIEAYREYFVLDPNAPDRRQIEGRIRALQGQ